MPRCTHPAFSIAALRCRGDPRAEFDAVVPYVGCAELDLDAPRISSFFDDQALTCPVNWAFWLIVAKRYLFLPQVADWSQALHLELFEGHSEPGSQLRLAFPCCRTKETIANPLRRPGTKGIGGVQIHVELLQDVLFDEAPCFFVVLISVPSSATRAGF